MIITFAAEIGMAAYVLWRYKLTPLTRLVLLILVLLAAFQLAEFMVCTGAANNAAWWSRLGYVAITLLPPLAIHLIYQIARAKRRVLLWPAYGTAAAFVAFFFLNESALTGHACLGNYAIFQLTPGASWLYTLYYYGWLAAGITLTAHFGRHVRHKPTHLALLGLLAGYGAFIIPTVAVNLFAAETVRGIPSIMCGFAVLLAFILVVWVLPVSQKKKMT